MSILYTVPGFEPITLRTGVVTHNHFALQPRLLFAFIYSML